jgi:mRNA interferase RelE/StbE
MRIKLHKDAIKQLTRLPEKEKIRILKAVNKLPIGDVKPLKSQRHKMRLRVGDYRIIYEYRDDMAYILEIGNRGDVYK